MTELFVAKTDCLQNKELFDTCYHTLPTFRKEKVDRLEHAEKKALSIGAFLLLAEALKKRGVPYQEIDFIYNPHGKPKLARFPEVHFNLSHSGSIVFCAVSDGKVGCDTECIRPIDPSLADRFFTPIEQEQLLKTDDRTKLFFRLWTLKESFLKATGESLSRLKDFSIIINENGILLDSDKNFYLKEFSLGDNYCYACCSETPDVSSPAIVNLENIKRPL